MNKILTLLLVISVLYSCSENPEKTVKEQPKSGSEDSLIKSYGLDKISLPEGFRLSIYAKVPNARSMVWGSRGTLFVGNRDQDKVYAVVDQDNNGTADSVYIIDEGLTMPCGVAFRDGSLYVAEISRILRYDSIESRLASPPDPVVVFDKFPTDTHHGWKYIAFGPDGKLYVPVGAPCNVCEKKDSVYASITRMNPDGSGLEIFAKGIRNSVGFDWHPKTGELWFTDNGRDNMGDEIPNCELNYAPKPGMHFGFPYCHQGTIPDPDFGKGHNCEDYVAPAALMGPHVAPLGMRFYTGDMFPEEFKNKVFIAQHGSWNRSVPIGYRVMTATVENNKVTSYEPFAEGWLQDSTVLGRPADVELAPDGALLISDDDKGLIYRVSFEETHQNETQNSKLKTRTSSK